MRRRDRREPDNVIPLRRKPGYRIGGEDTAQDSEEDDTPGMVSDAAMRIVLSTLNRWQEGHPDEEVRRGEDDVYRVEERL